MLPLDRECSASMMPLEPECSVSALARSTVYLDVVDGTSQLQTDTDRVVNS